MSDQSRYGLLAAFATPEALLDAAAKAREKGTPPTDAFTPYPLEGLTELLDVRPSRIPVYAFAGGALASLGIIGLQLYSITVNYPLDVGGRPLDSWTAFLVPGFECVILGAALTAFFGMLAGNRLPQFYHPVFNAQSFSLASGDRFYLLFATSDPAVDRTRLRRLLRGLHAVSIEDVQE